MNNGWLPAAMFLTMLVFLLMGVPVSFALGGTAVLFAAIGVQQGAFEWVFMYALPERIFGVMSNYVLLAVPFFLFMGSILEKSRMAEGLLKSVGDVFGATRGGLAFAVVGVGTLLAASTGVVGASVTAMGLISLPVMLRYGYDKSFAAGVITASGTLGQIIPPSVVLVVLGDQLGVSVGDLFVGALIPGLMLAGLFAVYVGFVAWRHPERAPAIPAHERPKDRRDLVTSVLRVMVPPLTLVVVVLGSIFLGIATPTEAGALGAVGALALTAVYGRLDRPLLRGSLDETLRVTTMVMWLLIGSTAFTLVFRGLDGDRWIEGMLTQLPGGRIGFLVAANLTFFVLGCFIDFFEIAFIALPLLVPAARVLGIDLVWFGVMLGMNLQTSFLTPPFGFSLFYLRGVAPPELSTRDIYRGVVPFIVLQLIMVAVVAFFPGIVLKE